MAPGKLLIRKIDWRVAVSLTASVRPGRKVCEAMRGLVEEAQHEIEEHNERGPILDLVVAGMQRRTRMCRLCSSRQTTQ